MRFEAIFEMGGSVTYVNVRHASRAVSVELLHPSNGYARVAVLMAKPRTPKEKQAPTTSPNPGSVSDGSQVALATGENITAKADARRLYVGGLLQRLRTRADFMRDFLRGQDQNPTLGLAAELGVRDVLRLVLPGRIGVTSGFMCDADGSLVAPVPNKSISPQTDVIFYDAMHACPLYQMDEIAVIAGRDVLGFIEVKDQDDGHFALRDRGTKDRGTKAGALPHVAKLASHAPHAFRAIVLVRATDTTNKRPAKCAYDQCKQEEKLTSKTVPHVIYCIDPGYLAIYEYTSNKLHFLDYHKDLQISALADFLRIISGFFAAHGLASASMARGLAFDSSVESKIVETLELKDRAPLPSLSKMIHEYDSKSAQTDNASPERVHSFEDALERFATNRIDSLFGFPTTGRNGDAFCAGIVIVARLKKLVADTDTDSPEYAASFFSLTDEGHLVCVDDASWMILYERPEHYLYRVCKLQPELEDPFELIGRAAATPERTDD